MPVLTAEQIDQAEDLPSKRVPVPAWKGDVFIAMLSGEERDAFEAEMSRLTPEQRLENFRSRLLVKCLVDEGRNRLFTDDQVRRLGRKNAATISELFDEARAYNRMAGDSIEEEEKNSEPAPSDASTSS